MAVGGLCLPAIPKAGDTVHATCFLAHGLGGLGNMCCVGNGNNLWLLERFHTGGCLIVVFGFQTVLRCFVFLLPKASTVTKFVGNAV
jgi:hypothetical protein